MLWILFNIKFKSFREKDLDFFRIKDIMNHNIIIDGSNFFDKEKLQNLGFKYFGIDR